MTVNPQGSAKPAFVLVHGSFHGPWCWSAIAEPLRSAGHEVAVPDLAAAVPPSGGRFPGLAEYAAEVARAVETMPGKAILVGHSMGGIVASQVAEWCADRLLGTVYICGLLLGSGETLLDFVEAEKHLGVEDLVLGTMQVSADGALATFPRAAAAGIFYNLCTPADAEWASGQLRPQPMAVYSGRLVLTPEKFGRVHRCYIKALSDRAVSPLYQDAMIRRTPCDQVFSLESDHSPFLSRPTELLDLLLRLARTLGGPR